MGPRHAQNDHRGAEEGNEPHATDAALTQDAREHRDGTRHVPLEHRIAPVEDRLAEPDADHLTHDIDADRRGSPKGGELFELKAKERQLGAGRVDEVGRPLGGERDVALLGATGHPGQRLVGVELREVHHLGVRAQFLVDLVLVPLFRRSLMEDEERFRCGSGDVVEKHLPGRALDGPPIDVPDDDHPLLGHHRQGVDQGVQRFGVEGGGVADVVVEIPGAGVDGKLHQGGQRLLLQRLLGAVEVVDRGQLTGLDLLPEGVEREGGHRI